MTFAAALLVSENLICQHGVGGQPRLPRCTFSRAPPLPAHSSASLLQRLHPSSRQQGTCTQATRLQDQSSSSREQEIEGLDKNYCECLSTDSVYIVERHEYCLPCGVSCTGWFDHMRITAVEVLVVH